MKMLTKNPIRIAIAAAVFMALTAGANAADVPQVHVKYGDLNLGTTAGAAVLYQRIRGAADVVCGVPDTRELAQIARAKACAAQTIAAVVAAVNAPVLTGVYQARTGETLGTRLAVIR